jgi:GAF domain-containing protein
MQKAGFALLKVGGQPIGTLMIANKVDNSNFDEEDLDVLSIFAGQAAVLIDNARLYAETHQRAVEADNLRQIAEQLTGAIAFEDVLPDVLQELTTLLDCEVAALGMLDAELGSLVYDPRFVHGRKMTAPIQMNIYSPGFAHSVALSRRDFTSPNLIDDERVLEAYVNMAQAIGLRNTAMVPLVIQNRSIGELAAFNRHGGEFNENDLPVLHAVAAQISAAIERSRLYKATDADLHARVEELNALDRIAQQLAEDLETDHIMDITRNEVSRGTSADGVSVVLLAPVSEWPDKNSPMLENRRGGITKFGKQLTPIELQAVVNKSPVVAADYDRPDMKATDDDARSALIEPMESNGEILGLIHVYRSAPEAFPQMEREFLNRVALQAALALANARRYSDQVRLNEVLRGRVDQFNNVYTLSDLVRRGESLSKVMDEFSRSLAEGVGFRKVTVYLLDEASDRLSMLHNSPCLLLFYPK